MQGIRNEHLRRPNAGGMFVTANYGIATTPAWEYLFVADPSSPDMPGDLRLRLEAHEGCFPGEVGDMRCELSVRCTIKSGHGADIAGLTAALEKESSRLVKGDLLQTEEEVARGISVLPGANGDIRLVLPLKEADFPAERREALVRWAGAALGGADVKVVEVAAEQFMCVEYVDEGALRAAASKMSDSELMELAAAGNNGVSGSQTSPTADRNGLLLQAIDRCRLEREKMGQKGLIPVQGRKRTVRNEEFMQIDRIKRKMEQAKLIEAEIVALRLYTGPMYVLYNAVLRRWPKPTFESLLGNHYETTISVISSGITKLSRTTRVPPNRLLYRGLGGMLLPEQFWRESGQGFLGGVEMGLMSTTSDKSVAIHYSGHSKKRAIIFEIAAGRVDVGASIGFLSQYPGEKEFLMQPLSCLEVMGRPRLERTAVGEVIVFPIRVNVNLKGLIVEELVERRKRLHLSMASNLQEELAQQIRSELECEMSTESDADQLAAIQGVRAHSPGLADTGDLDSMEMNIKKEYQAVVRGHEALPAAKFNDETEFKRLIMEMIDAKVYAVEKIKFYLRFRKAVQKGEEDRAILERVLSAALKDYANPYVELGLRTGVDDFPWHDFISKKPAIDLGLWTPVSKEEWKLDKVRQVLAQIYAEGDNVRLVTIKGKALQFPQGLFNAEVAFDSQNISEILHESCFIVSMNKSLTSLSLRNNELRARDWAAALDSLTRCVNLRTLCGITFPESLFQGSLAKVTLKGKKLDDDSIAALCGLLPRSASMLTQLDLGINAIGDIGATAIAETLPALPALKTLILCDNQIGDSGLGALAMGLTCLRQLQLVNVDTNPFSRNALSALSSAVSDGVTLGCVSLAEQNAFVQKYFKKADAAALEAVLRPDLNLSGATIGAEGARALSGFLRRPAVARTVTTLKVYANEIGDEGAKSIAAALPYLTELRVLSMRHNKITSAGAKAIAVAIPHLPKLTSLVLNGNSLDDESKAAIKENCRLHCPALTELQLEKESRR